ncbi:MAG TPA: thymidylate synthase [Planctomycetota bacterium]|nr:thymidylate synthase [Planctomycetota bacterium]
MTTLRIEIDGGSRGNPGPAASAAILREAPGAEPVWAGGWPLGEATNNVAEYSALVRALEVAAARGARRVEIRSDSELLVKQLTGKYKVGSPLIRPLYARSRELLEGVEGWTARWVPREENSAADALVNRALDSGRPVGDAAEEGSASPMANRKKTQPSAGPAAGVAPSGSIPVLFAEGSSLAEAWEKSLLALASSGGRMPTEYDQKLARAEADEPSLDCTMLMVVREPASEPFIHRAFPGGLEDLEEYRQEVLDGIKDHWVRDPNDPKDERWEYTYHQRLFKYEVPGVKGRIDQLARCVEKLAKSPFTRRAQAITWQPWFDLDCYDPACLQSIWLRVVPDARDVWHLNMDVRFRSRDAYDAAYMNCFALISLQERLAGELAEKAGREVRLGRYADFSDSYHIYGRRLAHFRENFLRQVKERSFEDRTWTREFAEEIFAEARPRIREKVAAVDAQRPPKPAAG